MEIKVLWKIDIFLAGMWPDSQNAPQVVLRESGTAPHPSQMYSSPLLLVLHPPQSDVTCHVALMSARQMPTLSSTNQKIIVSSQFTQSTSVL